MNVNSISFGKTVKVFAPLHEATRIANAANGDHTVPRKVQKEVKRIFNDTKKGHAVAFSFNDDPEYSYIFSGKESKEYLENLYDKVYLIKCIRMNYPPSKALPAILKVREDFADKTTRLIQKTQEHFVLITIPKCKDIKIVN